MTKLTVTQASRNFSDLLNRVRYQREHVVLTRGDEPIAELRPLPEPRPAPSLRSLATLLASLRMPDEAMAADLERIQAAVDRAPDSPWGS